MNNVQPKKPINLPDNFPTAAIDHQNDNAHFSVPESGTYLLLAIGLIIIFLLCKRKVKL